IRRIHRLAGWRNLHDEGIPQSAERALDGMHRWKVFGEGVACDVPIAIRIDRDSGCTFRTAAANERRVLEPRSIGAQRGDERVGAEIRSGVDACPVSWIERDRCDLGALT